MKKHEKAVDELSERVIDMASQSVLEEANDFLDGTPEYFMALHGTLEYVADDEPSAAVVAGVAKEFLESAKAARVSSDKMFAEVIEGLEKLVKNP